MKPLFFSNQSAFRKWLEKNHQSKTELIVGFYKVDSGKPSMTWSESVDQALCFGWIDGVRRSIDQESYQIRFTPRKKASIWSAINIEKVERLIAHGLMHDAGLEIYKQRTENKSKVYSFEQESVVLSPEFEKSFKKNKIAWKYFISLSASYQKSSIHWVMSAKQENTRLKRIQELIADCESGINKWKDNKYNKKSGK
jgi:uncharacterized protein YdeI (YjbR/CyaY-like superfamily)